MNDRVRAVLESVIDKFKAGEIPDAVAVAMFPKADMPCSRWSLFNRLLVLFARTSDARGFRQWQMVNRHVVKGAKAFHIMVPFIKKAATDTGDEKAVLMGFGLRPVFRLEDTAGEPLAYQQLEVPDLPLMERAQEWGLSVKAVPGNRAYLGYYAASKGEIGLATPEEKTFFHELSHAAHERVRGKLVVGQDPIQEIVAELAAAVLCRMVGKQHSDTLGNSYRYIDQYAREMKTTPHQVCLKVLTETEKVLGLILFNNPQTQEASHVRP
jgi:hypothetical protein